MTISTSGISPCISVAPARPNLDTELHIRLEGLPPDGEVTVHAGMVDRGGAWRASACFVAAPDGTVDLRRDPPTRGSYRTVDPMGLVWSMRPDASAEAAGQERSDPASLLAPTALRLVVEAGGTEVAAVDVLRRRVPDGLHRTDVREDRLVGTLYRPEGAGRLPGVLLLGGSEGGMHADDAALLAAHGHAVLALAYYGVPGLPATLRDIPLEYFGRGLGYLRRHPRVLGDRLAVMGGSKGGEAALLTGATFPEVRAVVSVVGSGLVTQGISQDVLRGSFLDIMDTPVASWTHRGRELPYLPNVVTPALRAAVAAGEPVALRQAFEPALERADLLPAATIPVERVHGGVLLISGDDDQGYGMAFHEVAARRLAASRHPHAWRHVVYAGAGHNIAAPPYSPTTRSLSPGPGVTFRSGGTPAADAAARANGWRETLRFLAAEIGPGTPPG